MSSTAGRRHRNRRPDGGWILPVLLVVAGIVTLLANVGAISWEQLGRLGDLWPLLLILAGMWLILSAVAAAGVRDLVMVVLVIVLAAGAVAYVATGPATGSITSASAPLAGNAAGRLVITGGAATTHLNVGDTGGDLYRARLRATGDQPKVTNAGGAVTIDFGSGSRSGFFSIRREADVTLSSEVPWTISVEGGALTVRGDLSDGRVQAFELGGGASSVDLKLPAPAGDTSLRFTGGALDVRLHRPAGTEVQVRVSGGGSTIVGDGRRTNAIGGDVTWRSAGWDAAADRYSVSVEGGAATVTLDAYQPPSR